MSRRARQLVMAALAAFASTTLSAAAAVVRVTARAPTGTMAPAWDKGIQPINRDSYYNAIACGKQGGARPLCLFYDADFCKNPDYALTFFTPYKQVAYEVWQEVRAGREAATPDYGAAQRTRVTLGVTPVAGAKNPLTAVTIRRGGREIAPATQSFDGAGGRVIFDFAPFAPTQPITIALVGKARTVECTVSPAVLRIFR